MRVERSLGTPHEARLVSTRQANRTGDQEKQGTDEKTGSETPAAVEDGESDLHDSSEILEELRPELRVPRAVHFPTAQ